MTDTGGLAAWLRLTLVPGLGGESQRKLLNAFGPPENIFAAGELAARSLIASRAERLFNTDNRAEIAAALDWASRPGQRILTLADAEYPASLLETADPPTLLYARGNLDLLQRPSLAVVGSRNATPAGVQTAEAFSRLLAQSGLTIVSGLALGIDAAAHRGALAGPGSTIAVIGTGCDRLYPARNQALAREILDKGLILSEFPLGTPPLAANFPRRNRIISGLSKGVLVVEAAPESGSLITARLAGEQGREVFAIPGSIHSPVSRGCHQLIKQGAKLVETAQDILDELGPLPVPPAEPRAQPPAPSQTQADEDPLLIALGHGPCTLDELAERSGQGMDTLLDRLLMLELEGQIAQMAGGRYQRLG